MPRVRVGGVELYYERAGVGARLLYISGTGGDLRADLGGSGRARTSTAGGAAGERRAGASRVASRAMADTGADWRRRVA